SFKLNTFYFIRKQDRLTEDIKAAFIKYIDMLSNDTYIAKNKNGIYKISLKDVLYFEVSHNDLYIHFVNGKEIKERKQIAIVYDEVKNKGFVMIGKSFVVNTKYIISINKSQRSVTLTNRQTIQMTVKQLEEFKHFFDNSQGEINDDI
ncbi:MAG: LytTR family transcriptional regulator, partial [Erysipelotrichaceae bacterium]|nr:LytTR family transcriptional regulator [Erysipelotrichaceae bacterium]